MEIERKFLFKKLPEHLDTYPRTAIEQAYVTTDPVIRIRKKVLYDAESSASGQQYILTVKGSGMLVRQEFELPISESSYRSLCRKADGNIISKMRYRIPLACGLTLELDIFSGLFDGLVMGEIEFPDEAAANAYVPPRSLQILREVTCDTHFQNSTMSAMNAEEIADFLSGLQSLQTDI